MAEGGILRWKIQKLDVKPSVSNKDILNPLPNPPDGYEWTVDEKTRTWSIQPCSCNINDKNPVEVEVASDLNPVQPPYFSDESSLVALSNKVSIPPPSYDDYLKQKYLEHVVMPTDTLQGICLRYKITAVRLRQVNHFSSSSLSLAPPKLYIPVTEETLKSGAIKVQDRTSEDFKMMSFMAEMKMLNVSISKKEATFYLDSQGWDVDAALKEARDDFEWEDEINSLSSVKIHTGVVVTDKGSKGELMPLVSPTKAQIELTRR